MCILFLKVWITIGLKSDLPRCILAVCWSLALWNTSCEHKMRSWNYNNFLPAFPWFPRWPVYVYLTQWHKWTVTSVDFTFPLPFSGMEFLSFHITLGMGWAFSPVLVESKSRSPFFPATHYLISSGTSSLHLQTLSLT